MARFERTRASGKQRKKIKKGKTGPKTSLGPHCLNDTEATTTALEVQETGRKKGGTNQISVQKSRPRRLPA